jgi:hypothetical protein
MGNLTSHLMTSSPPTAKIHEYCRRMIETPSESLQLRTISYATLYNESNGRRKEGRIGTFVFFIISFNLEQGLCHHHLKRSLKDIEFRRHATSSI